MGTHLREMTVSIWTYGKAVLRCSCCRSQLVRHGHINDIQNGSSSWASCFLPLLVCVTQSFNAVRIDPPRLRSLWPLTVVCPSKVVRCSDSASLRWMPGLGSFPTTYEGQGIGNIWTLGQVIIERTTLRPRHYDSISFTKRPQIL